MLKVGKTKIKVRGTKLTEKKTLRGRDCTTAFMFSLYRQCVGGSTKKALWKRQSEF